MSYPITQIFFENKIQTYQESESEADYYRLASNLLNEGFELEGILLLLSTWNFANFRYHMKQFSIDALQITLENLKPFFNELRNENIRSCNLIHHSYNISTIYTHLSAFNGIKHTGASKIMQLKLPKLCIMWDSYIRREKSKRFYRSLDVFQMGIYNMNKYENSASGYLSFLSNMQQTYSTLNFINSDSMAKLIDEFNFASITLPIQAQERNERNL